MSPKKSTIIGDGKRNTGKVFEGRNYEGLTAEISTLVAQGYIPFVVRNDEEIVLHTNHITQFGNNSPLWIPGEDEIPNTRKDSLVSFPTQVNNDLHPLEGARRVLVADIYRRMKYIGIDSIDTETGHIVYPYSDHQIPFAVLRNGFVNGSLIVITSSPKEKKIESIRGVYEYELKRIIGTIPTEKKYLRNTLSALLASGNLNGFTNDAHITTPSGLITPGEYPIHAYVDSSYNERLSSFEIIFEASQLASNGGSKGVLMTMLKLSKPLFDFLSTDGKYLLEKSERPFAIALSAHPKVATQLLFGITRISGMYPSLDIGFEFVGPPSYDLQNGESVELDGLVFPCLLTIKKSVGEKGVYHNLKEWAGKKVLGAIV